MKGYRTILVDLAKPLDDIRASLAHKWRNQLNAAVRRNIAIEVTRGADAVAHFSPLLDETIRRKGFTTELGASFYDRVQRRAEDGDRMTVAVATEDGAGIAGVVASIMGDTAVYVLGATTEKGMKCKASYALQWRIIEAAREAGCRWYDLGGIDPENNPGVYHFKSGFGGHDVIAPGPFEWRPSGVPGLLSRFVEDSYLKYRHWRSSAATIIQRQRSSSN